MFCLWKDEGINLDFKNIKLILLLYYRPMIPILFKVSLQNSFSHCQIIVLSQTSQKESKVKKIRIVCFTDEKIQNTAIDYTKNWLALNFVVCRPTTGALQCVRTAGTVRWLWRRQNIVVSSLPVRRILAERRRLGQVECARYGLQHATVQRRRLLLGQCKSAHSMITI